MSDTDSFINEVSEEVRRDRLFRLLRRYGWIAVVAVVLLVGAATWNEWRKARIDAAAQEFGDAILAALEQNDAADRRAALDGIETVTPRQAALVAMFAAQEAEEGSVGVTDTLAALSVDPDLPQVYRELAVLKYVMRPDNGLDGPTRIARLEPLIVPGAAYRLLALEQIALAEIETGDTEAALSRLQAILGEEQVSQGLRRRVSQLIVALGGTLDAT